jgi:hypothetical protein
MAQDWKERQQWRNEERRRIEEQDRWRVRQREDWEGRDLERERYGEYEDYGAGAPYRGYEPGIFPGTGAFGYVPSPYPEQRLFDWDRPASERPGEGVWSGRHDDVVQNRDHDRGWWDRAKDEMLSWVGDDDAEQRRRMDEARSHSGRGPKGYTRSDDRIREDVSERLTDDWLVDASDIEVAVSGGEVTLAGTVDGRQAKRRAEDCADRVSGVRHVQNNLRVRDSDGGRGIFDPASGAASARFNK